MSAQTDFSAVVSTLKGQIGTLTAALDSAKQMQAGLDAKIAAAVQAQADKDDAAFQSATNDLSALSADLASHLDTASSAATNAQQATNDVPANSSTAATGGDQPASAGADAPAAPAASGEAPAASDAGATTVP